MKEIARHEDQPSDMGLSLQAQTEQLLKAHVDGYTRKDGVTVKPHETSVVQHFKGDSGNGSARKKERDLMDRAAAGLGFSHGANPEFVASMRSYYLGDDARLAEAAKKAGSTTEELRAAFRVMHAPTAPAEPAKKPGMMGRLFGKAFDDLADLVKAQVKGYSKKDGTVVAPHSTKVIASANEGGYGFKGEAVGQHHSNTGSYEGGEEHADRAFSNAAHHLLAQGHFDKPDHARDFLDAKDGRHLHDALTYHTKDSDLSKMPPEKLAAAVADYHSANPKTKPKPTAAKPKAAAAPAQPAAPDSAPRESGPAKNAAKFDEGDAVKVTGKVDGQGKTGVVSTVAPSGHFHVVKHADGSKSSYHESDLSPHDGDEDNDEVDDDGGQAAANPAGSDAQPVPGAKQLSDKSTKPGAAPEDLAAKPAPKSGAQTPSPAGAGAVKDAAPAGAVPREAKGDEASKFPGEDPAKAAAKFGNTAAGQLPMQADGNAAGWDNLPDEENPKFAVSSMGSKALGALATAKPEHAKAYAHAELANRGLDHTGNWQGFDKANALHAPSIPADHQPHPQVAEGMQSVHGKVLQAAAQGHLNLQDRARSELAGRGHDVHGNWIGFDKAAQTHGFDSKTGKKLAAKPAGGSGTPKGPQQPDMFKALSLGKRPMFFVSAGRAAELRAAMGLSDNSQDSK